MKVIVRFYLCVKTPPIATVHKVNYLVQCDAFISTEYCIIRL